jgi:hypothetical protein
MFGSATRNPRYIYPRIHFDSRELRWPTKKDTAYRKRLKQLILDNCKNGKHKDEYMVDDLR